MDQESHREGWWLATAVAVWNVVQNSVPRRVYGWLNLAGSVVIVGIGRRSLGLHREDLRLGAGAVGRGARVAAPLAAAVVGGVGAVASSASGRRMFRDERVERRGGLELAKETLFRIPVGTALFEELLFRGLVEGWARRRHGARRGTLVASFAFGLWHVIPTLRTLSIYRSGRFRTTPTMTVLGVGVAVGATAVAGLGFSALGRRADSVVAPAVIHGVVNATAYVAAWVDAPRRL